MPGLSARRPLYKEDKQRPCQTVGPTAGEVIYDLDARAYNLLRHRTHSVPLSLVLFVMPAERPEWVAHNEHRQELRRCTLLPRDIGAATIARWVSFVGVTGAAVKHGSACDRSRGQQERP